MSKTYHGNLGRAPDGADGWGAIVWRVEGGKRSPLPLRLDLYSHSPDGFMWGYGGSGPAQLALAILADATGNDPLALGLHQRYKWAVIAGLSEPWQIRAEEVLAWVAGIDETELDLATWSATDGEDEAEAL